MGRHVLPHEGVVTGPNAPGWPIVALVTGSPDRGTVSLVERRAAVEVLAEHNPEAAAWWRENTPHLLRPARFFLFPHDVTEIVHVSGADPRDDA